MLPDVSCVNGNLSYTGNFQNLIYLRQQNPVINYIILYLLKNNNRYVPVGLLEVVPQKINERAPPFNGRDDLETLMASPKSSDWVKLR